jgi:endonuclease YncB( thermonuclease family)
MIKKIMITFTLLLSLFLIVGCNNKPSNELTLPDLTGMNRAQALDALSGMGLKITFDEVINNQLTEGHFFAYGNNLQVGAKVEKGQEITIIFVKHLIINGVVLPNLAGLNIDQITAILIELDIEFNFEDKPTDDIEEGLFAGYANNYQPEMVVDFWTEITIYLAIPVLEEFLIISKYIEGISDNKAIEIANRSGEAIDLTNYRISIYENGSTTPTRNIDLVGTLAPNSVRVYAYSGSEAGLLAKADVISSDLFFLGNAAVAITYKNDMVVDIIGNIGWQLFIIHNETFVRRPHVTRGVTEYNAQDWDIYRADHYEILGSHPTVFPNWSTFTFTPEMLLIPFNLPMGMVRVSYGYANDGDTSEFNSLDPNFENFTGLRRVRFVGIDTPEMSGNKPGVTYPQPFAVEATQYLRNILENATEIYIMHDPLSGISDGYERSLGLVWADGVLVNLEMVRMGYSAAMYFDPQQRLIFNNVSLNRLFQRAEAEARENNRNIWSSN